MSGPRDSSGKSGGGRDWFSDAGGRAHSSRESAIEGSLAFEGASGTGAGCGQSADNVDSDSGDQDSDSGDNE